MGRTRRLSLTLGIGLVVASVVALYPAAGAAARPERGEPEPAGDFNGDGFHDLAVGVPNEDVGNIDDAGAVEVIYGTAQGLDGDLPVDDQFWHQNSSGIADTVEEGDQFGAALAWGDFNRDGFDDLAIGAPFEDVPTGLGNQQSAGAVHVLRGSSSGLTASGSAFITQDSSAVPDVVETGDRFGAALAAGSLGNGGASDLAVGVPHENFGSLVNNGAIHVMYGQRNEGLGGGEYFHQDTAGVPGVNEAEDRFGSALHIANFGLGEQDDLVVGSPLEDASGQNNCGAVVVMYGSSDGVTTTGSQLWYQGTVDVAGSPEADDQFGFSLAAGNFGDSVESDLAVGVPLEDAGGTDDGAVNVLYGSPGGLVTTGNQVWHSGVTGVPGDPDDDDRFGTAVAAGNFGGAGQADLAIGVPRNTLSGISSGAVVILPGASSGLSTGGAQYWNQDSSGIEGETEDIDQFGESLAAANYGRTAEADLAVGVPTEDRENSLGFQVDGAAGAVNMIFGSGSGLTSTGSQFWWQASDGIHDTAEDLDQFGTALA